MSSRHFPFISVIVVALSCIPVFANYIPNWHLNNNSDRVYSRTFFDRKHNKDPHTRTLTQQLNLTFQQRQQIGKIRQKYKQPIAKLGKNLNSARRELIKMMAGVDSIDTIRNQHQQITQLQQEIGELHLSSMLEIRQILTPQQRQQFVRIMRTQREIDRK
jgi:Spy/CpxP family protein refolding chaperone